MSGISSVSGSSVAASRPIPSTQASQPSKPAAPAAPASQTAGNDPDHDGDNDGGGVDVSA